MNTASPAAVIDGLTKRYGDLAAVDDLSFDIRRGEIFALLGPNGAGKSTTIEMLEGFRTPTSGRLEVLGENPAKGDGAWRARIGVVSQSTPEIERFTIREIVRHFASLYPNARPVDETIERCGLAAKANARVGKLSGGQKRRLDVALGIIGSPEMLFLDEPTTGFDPAARREFWSLISDLRDEGTTILLTTHYLDEAEHLSDRVGVIAAGKLIDLAPVDELGGAEARTPIVQWREADGREREERTHEPATLAASLVERAGGEPDRLTITRPSLEDIYLGLIAPHQREREEEGGGLAATADAHPDTGPDAATPPTRHAHAARPGHPAGATSKEQDR